LNQDSESILRTGVESGGAGSLGASPSLPHSSLVVAMDGPAAERGAAAPAVGLPCQDNDNCIKREKYKRPSLSGLTPNQKKVRHKMIMAVEWMARKHGIERVGLLTLSFGVPGSGKGSYETWALRQKAKDWDFVQGRWHSFCTNIVAKRYQDWVCVFEQHKDHVWHLHVVVATKKDIRTGTDIEMLSNYKLPYWLRRGKHLRNEALAAEWTSLRKVACHYRFGRVELLPVKKSGDALGQYLGDYLVKTYNRIPPGRRCRLVRFSKRIGQGITVKFSTNDLGNLIYRTRLRMAADMLNFRDYGDFADYFGPRWNFYLKDTIAWIPMPLRFLKGAYESGLAAQVLNHYAHNPSAYLDERGKQKLAEAERDLWRHFHRMLGESADRYQSDNDGDDEADTREHEIEFDKNNAPF